MFSAIVYAENTQCNCGDFESGVTSYAVIGDAGCCSGEATGLGMTGEYGAFTEYRFNEGAWSPVRTTVLNPSEAQSSCCGENA